MPGRSSQRVSRSSQSQSQRAENVEKDNEQNKRRKSPRKKPEKERSESEEEEEETLLSDPAVKKQKVDDLIRYFMMASQTQKAVQRLDIIKNCLGNEYGKGFNELFEAAKEKMRFLFGIDVLQSDEKKGFYYLSNVLRCTDFMKISKEQSAKDTLLYSILSNIYMQDPEGKEVTEDTFKNFLQKLDVRMDDNKGDPVFGDAKKLITKTFVEQGWLAIRRQPNEKFGGTDQFYSWGWRSRLVLSRGDMLNFVSEIMYGDGNHARLYKEHLAVAEREDQIGHLGHNNEA